jgi:tyrosyl-DNA phosphodiesterase 2
MHSAPQVLPRRRTSLPLWSATSCFAGRLIGTTPLSPRIAFGAVRRPTCQRNFASHLLPLHLPRWNSVIATALLAQPGTRPLVRSQRQLYLAAVSSPLMPKKMVSFIIPPTVARPPSDTVNKRRSVPQPFFAYLPNVVDSHHGWRTARPLTPSESVSSASSSSSSSVPEPSADNLTTAKPDDAASTTHAAFAQLQVFTWNIDFSCPESVARMRTALVYMKPIIEAVPETDAIVIFFQEMTSQTLHVIHETDWVRKRFYTTDQVPSFWLSTYGTATLVDKRLVITGEGVRRLRLRSEFGRDGLFVDLLLQPEATDQADVNGDDADASEPQQEKVLRLCNVHLESLASNPPIRPTQFASLAPHLQTTEMVHASIMAGDTNANRPYDRTLPAEHSLSDAYLALGGVEGDAEGHTWGYQSGRTHYPPTRLDKILFTGSVKAAKLERFGVGVMVDDVGARSRLENIGEEEYVTDHYGLRATFEIEGGLGLARGSEAWKACCGPNSCSCARPGAFDPAYGIGMI